MPYSSYKRWKTKALSGTPYLSVIIPVYNEENRILPTIGAVVAYVSAICSDWELLVVDDGSTDGTVACIEELSFANLRLLKAHHQGKGGALRQGVLAARGRCVLFTDADNSTPIEEIKKLLYKLELQHFDVAVGSRAAGGAAVKKKSLLRKCVSKMLHTIVSTMFPCGVQDTQCGFKMYTTEAARRLYSIQKLKGFAFDLEVLYLAHKFRYKVAEVPVEWINAPDSKVNLRKDIPCFVRDLCQIKWNELRGSYA